MVDVKAQPASKMTRSHRQPSSERSPTGPSRDAKRGLDRLLARVGWTSTGSENEEDDATHSESNTATRGDGHVFEQRLELAGVALTPP
jgi:hypothetical protein